LPFFGKAKERPLDLGQPDLTSYLEVQVNLINRREDLLKLDLSPLTLYLLKTFKSVSDLDDENTYISYIKDTISTISYVK
jgi:hypothetical protein